MYNFLVREEHRRQKHARTFGVWPPVTGHGLGWGDDGTECVSLYRIVQLLRDTDAPGFWEQKPWLRDVAGNILNQTAGSFKAALENWLKNAGTVRPPCFKRRDASGSFSFQNARVLSMQGPRCDHFDFVALPLPRHIEQDPWVAFRRHRRARGEPKTATISYHGGQWFVSILYEWTPAKTPVHRHPGTLVGIDRNVRNLCATFDGTNSTIEPGTPTSLGPLISRLQRRADKKQPKKNPLRSHRHEALLRRIARLRHRQTTRRDDNTSKVAHRIASQYELVAIDALNVKNMTASAAGTLAEPGTNVAAKRGLNRAILHQGWGQLETKLVAKAAAYGGQVARQATAYSSQECDQCGHTSPENRNGALFRCTACGREEHADVHAARIHFNRAKAPAEGDLVAGRGGSRVRRPNEPSTAGQPADGALQRPDLTLTSRKRLRAAQSPGGTRADENIGPAKAKTDRH